MKRFSTRRRFGLAALALALGTFGSAGARADPMLYVTAVAFGPNVGPDEFGTVDAATGRFTEIGALNTPGYSIYGLGGVGDGFVYGVGYSFDGLPGELYRISTATAAATDLGALPYIPYAMAGNPGGPLYSIDSTPQGNLYATDPATNTSKLIGPTGVLPDGLMAITPGGTLYTVSNGSLYRIDPTTGASTLVGATGDDASGYFAGAFVGDTLYGFHQAPRTVDTISTADASVTVGPSLQGLPLQPQYYLVVAATAVPSAVPEPSTLALAAAGLVSLALLRWRKRGRGPCAGPSGAA